jgi:predicted TPR repeat methyltransferase
VSAQDLAEAFRLLDAGKRDAATRRAEALLRRDPRQAGAHYLLGLVALDQKRGVKARAHFTQALAHGPVAVPVLVALARAERLAGGDALKVWRQALDAGLSDPIVLAEAADVARVEGDGPQTLLFLESAASDTAPPEVWNNLGSARLEAGDVDGALGAFNAALDCDPGYTRARANRGAALLGLGLGAEAAADLEWALSADPTNRVTARNLALAHKATRRFDAARALLNQLLSERDEPMIRLDLATLELMAGAPATALAVLASLPSGARVAHVRGIAYEALGDVQNAIEAQQIALAEDPADGLGAGFALARLGVSVPARAPAAFVRQLFDDYAGRFDRELVQRLEYRAPALLRQTWDNLGRAAPKTILDLGCGTGLAGEAFADLGAAIDGVDLSVQMLLRAEARGCYRRLIEADLDTALADTAAGSVDLVLAADVLVYIGDLAPVLAGMARVLVPGGTALFTLEAADSGTWTLHQGNRYAHAHAYVAGLLEGWEGTITATSTRQDRGEDVPGLLVCLSTRA